MLKKFFSYYKPHKKLFAIDLICSFLFAVSSLAYPFLARMLINKYVPDKDLYMIISMGVALLGIYLMQAGINFIIQYWGHILGIRIQGAMRSELFVHLEKLPFSYFDDHKTGSIMSRMVSDLFEIAELSHHGPEDTFISIVSIIGAFILLAIINIYLTLIIFLVIPFMIIFAFVRRRKMSASFKKSREKVSEINASIESSISGIRVAKAYTAMDCEVAKFEKTNTEFMSARKGAYKNMGIFFSGMNLFRNILYLFILVGGGLFYYYEIISGGDFLAFALYVNALLNPIMSLVNIFEQIQDGMTGFKRFREIMDVAPETEPANPIEPTDLFGDIEFKNVTFSYKTREQNENTRTKPLSIAPPAALPAAPILSDEKKNKDGKREEHKDHKTDEHKAEEIETRVLSGVNISIKKGSTVAFVGPSGGGKTTLCHLIPRFYEVDDGQILINNYDITTLRRETLRRSVGIVAQDVFLFGGSISDNIRYGKQSATDDEIIEAAKSANIHDFIMGLPKKYDTEVGERGIKLSGGQKQRVSIARAFLKNPPILILDEATSALDSYTEVQIQKSLEELSRGRTTIVVAHRLSTIKNADEIIVITSEGIRERGTHSQLLEQGGYYAHLYSYYQS